MNFKQIHRNRTRVWNRVIEYIVIHDTGNSNESANAEMHYQYFNNAYRGSSADFFVDDLQILKINDYKKYRSWHCGDGGGEFGITNHNSVGVELCINKGANFEKTLRKAMKLVANLMYDLDVDISKVVRHYDASRKICPRRLSLNNWAAWEIFKKGVLKKHHEIKLDKQLETLRNAGIINTPKYWKQKASEVEYFDIFIQNVADHVKNKGT